MSERSIFLAALEKDNADERATYLEGACAGDPALRRRVEALLQSHQEAGDFLRRPALEGAAHPGVTQTDPGGGADGDLPLDFLDPPAQPSALGRLGHYEVVGVIGRGGFGVVLKALDPALNRFVAIKVLAPQLATSVAARKRFAREAKAAAAVSHEHVVAIHAVEEARGLPYLVMEYVSGVSLQERLDRSGAQELAEVLRIGTQAAQGLAAAHAQGLVHRDVKPANILLHNGVERVKITDFGLARAADDASLTQSGVVAGTPQYMAPEQARGEAVDHRADLFSLGSVLYALCTGHPPFRAATTLAVLRRVTDDTPRPVHEINPQIPVWMGEIIARLHAKDPAERFQSAGEVAELLGQCLAHVQQPAQVPLPARLTRPKSALKSCALLAARAGALWGIVSVVVGLLLAGAYGGLAFSRFGEGWLHGSGAARPDPATEEGSPAPGPLPGQVPGPVPDVVPGPPRGIAAAVAPTDGPFVVLPHAGARRRTYLTLAQAVKAAGDGDTIEVCSSEPVVTDTITVNKRLTIRPGEVKPGQAAWPVLRLSAAAVAEGKPLIETTAPLVLEGLHLELANARPWAPELREERVVVADRAPFYAANCRFVISRKGEPQYGLTAVRAVNLPVCALRNCLFLQADGVFLGIGTAPRGSQVLVENCLIRGAYGISLGCSGGETADARVTLAHSTVIGQAPLVLQLSRKPPAGGADGRRAYHIDSVENVFKGALHLNQLLPEGDVLPAGEAEKALRRLVDYREERNLHSLLPGRDFLVLTRNHQPMAATRPRPKLADWEQFWSLRDTGSIQAQVKLRGDDPLWRAGWTGFLTRAEYDLTDKSPGRGAGKGGRDLGADTNVAGDGGAYDRWRRTPAYQQWLQDTGQVEKKK